MPGGEEMAREIEREVMLQIIDQRWRDHLSEMDYLREGINLRAMGQQDPLVAWQREGFSMFGQLIEAIQADYLRYVLHVDAEMTPVEEPSLAGAVYEAPDDSDPAGGFSLAPPAAPTTAEQAMGQIGEPVLESFVPVVKDENAKLGRNDPCWCGSGKKFKQCHGAA